MNVAHPQRAEPPGREASAGGTKASSHPPPWSRPGAQSPTTTTLEKPGIPVPQAHHEGPAGRRQAMTDSVEAAGAEGLPGPGPGADGRLRGTRPLPGADRCRHPPRAWGRATRSSAGRSSQRPERSWRRRRTRPRWPPPAEETPASFPGFETSRDIGSGMISGELADLRLSTSSHRPRHPADRVEGDSRWRRPGQWDHARVRSHVPPASHLRSPVPHIGGNALLVRWSAQRNLRCLTALRSISPSPLRSTSAPKRPLSRG